MDDLKILAVPAVSASNQRLLQQLVGEACLTIWR
jgi:hypothetical protein